jgi:hypothetical protein
LKRQQLVGKQNWMSSLFINRFPEQAFYFGPTVSKLTIMSPIVVRAKKVDSDGPFPICNVGEYLCMRPSYQLQIFTDYCEHCGKHCHESCGELLDVPHKFLETEPGFYCNKCITLLPKTLYPKIPKNGIPRNVPKVEHDGESFEMYMTKRMEVLDGKKATAAKKKEARKVKTHPVVNTRSRASRPRRTSSSIKKYH